MALLVFAAPQALALDVQLIGTFGDKAAVLSIDSGEPKTVRVGQRVDGVTVVSVDKGRATVLVEGKRRTLAPGAHYSSQTVQDSRQSVVLTADSRGHFYSEGSVNGGAVRFLVDTGATSVVLPASDAQRLGLKFRQGKPAILRTANGMVPVWRIQLDTVKVGGIELGNIDATVVEQGLDIALLGMSFLNRLEMRRDGDRMTLKRRF